MKFIKIAQYETYYIYQCTKCYNRTSYCLKCNKTMDALLNSLFFKCFFCKVLTRIVQRESISPNHSNNINRFSNNNTCEATADYEIKNLFHQNIYSENNTPMKNLISGCFNTTQFNKINPNVNQNHLSKSID